MKLGPDLQICLCDLFILPWQWGMVAKASHDSGSLILYLYVISPYDDGSVQQCQAVLLDVICDLHGHHDQFLSFIVWVT